jgi:hypothetical protein
MLKFKKGKIKLQSKVEGEKTQKIESKGKKKKKRDKNDEHVGMMNRKRGKRNAEKTVSPETRASGWRWPIR